MMEASVAPQATGLTGRSASAATCASKMETLLPRAAGVRIWAGTEPLVSQTQDAAKPERRRGE